MNKYALGKQKTLAELCDKKDIEIRALKSALIKHAAFIARELHDDAITEAQDRRLYDLIQRMKKDAGLK